MMMMKQCLFKSEEDQTVNLSRYQVNHTWVPQQDLYSWRVLEVTFILQRLCTFSNHLSSFAVVDFRLLHPFKADYLVSEQFSFTV
jgi:hypothetical protein